MMFVKPKGDVKRAETATDNHIRQVTGLRLIKNFVLQVMVSALFLLNVPAYATIVGSTVDSVPTSAIVAAGATTLVQFQVVVPASVTLEYVHQVDVTFPAGWTVTHNTMDTDTSGIGAPTPSNPTANAIRYTGPDPTFGFIASGTTWNFWLNVTVPGGTPAGPYAFNYTLTGDGWDQTIGGFGPLGIVNGAANLVVGISPPSLAGSTVDSVPTSTVVAAGATTLVQFQVVVPASVTLEYVHQVDVTFPAGWTVTHNTMDTDTSGIGAPTPSNPTANAIRYTGPDPTFGFIASGTTWNFWLNVTVPGGTPAGPYAFNYTLTGDGWDQTIGGFGPLGIVNGAANLVVGVPPPPPSPLIQVIDLNGFYTASTDGCGVNGAGGSATIGNCPITINKPAGATTASVWALVAGDAGTATVPALVPMTATIGGTPVNLTLPTAVQAGPQYNVAYGDITAAVSTALDALPVGANAITLTEISLLEGMMLFVVWNDPNVTIPTSIALSLGSVLSNVGAVAGTLATSPINPAMPGYQATFGAGIAFSTGNLAGNVQTSSLSVNGTVLSTLAGGFDDGALANGALFTIGGEGDLPAVSNLDELYDVSASLVAGSTATAYSFQSTAVNQDDIFTVLWMQVRGVDLPADYGDAPASYGSASHINDATNYLGALIDSDTGDWGNGVDANGNATDDDTVGDPAGGVDDEDGVTLPAMTQGQTVAIPVIVTGAGTLNSWIDWNGDGDFLDVSEQIATDVTDGGAGDTDALANGTIALSITVPVTAATTPTYARFRFGSAGLAASSADILGEVEDYQLVISATPVITLLKSVQIFSDPVNGTTNAKAIPGGVAMYTILATNSGAGTADNIIINDAVPANTAIMVTDIGLPGSGPVAFVDGTAPNLPSGLTYTFTSLADAADSLDFSNDGGTTWTYTPTADPNGLDSAVTDIRVKPTGVYSAASGGNNAVFSILFKVGVQ